MKNKPSDKDTGPTPQQVRSWINRQRTLAQPNQTYIRWLRKNFRVTVEATVIKRNLSDI
jgi:hypothetical protein